MRSEPAQEIADYIYAELQKNTPNEPGNLIYAWEMLGFASQECSIKAKQGLVTIDERNSLLSYIDTQVSYLQAAATHIDHERRYRQAHPQSEDTQVVKKFIL